MLMTAWHVKPLKILIPLCKLSGYRIRQIGKRTRSDKRQERHTPVKARQADAEHPGHWNQPLNPTIRAQQDTNR